MASKRQVFRERQAVAAERQAKALELIARGLHQLVDETRLLNVQADLLATPIRGMNPEFLRESLNRLQAALVRP